MSEPLDELYFQWLYRQVASVRLKNPARTYWSLAKKLHTKEFLWLIPNDDNRVEDGRDLRYEFLHENGLDRDPDWLGLGCSMLEMLIALSRRLSFEGDGEPNEWFWAMLENLGIRNHSDGYYYDHRGEEDTVDDILDAVIWRTYEPNGIGGLFPLENPKQDQRDVEIRYQMAAYLIERM